MIKQQMMRFGNNTGDWQQFTCYQMCFVMGYIKINFYYNVQEAITSLRTPFMLLNILTRQIICICGVGGNH